MDVLMCSTLTLFPGDRIVSVKYIQKGDWWCVAIVLERISFSTCVFIIRNL